MWIADVGENTEEEINKVSATAAGLNYGWNCYEGNTQTTTNCAPDPDFTFPIASYYSNTGGFCSITGGYAYTGTLYRAFTGNYFFADLCTDRISYISELGGAITWSAPFTFVEGISCFGEDRNGELYAGGYYGSVYKIIDISLNTKSFDKPKLLLYPNPAVAQVSLKADPIGFPVIAKIVDISGKLLLDQQLESGTHAIATGALQRGIYMVVVTDKNGAVFNSKLVIE